MHGQDEAIEVADKIIVTNKGRIEQIGTPLEVYENPQTAFTSGFFGQAAVVKDYTVFKSFVKINGADGAIIRPEFVKITKKNEVQNFKASAVEGTVERVLFRGDRIEYAVRVNGVLLNTKRNLDEEKIEVGEKVDVFVYRMFVNVGDKAVLLKNSSIRDNVVVI
jgi:sulfate transport system ATP-binding protein